MTVKDKQTEKFVKYGGYVELSKSDVIEETTDTISDLIREAYKTAIQNNIKANTVVLNKTFAKTNGFTFAFMDSVMTLPPMICGLEVHVSDELPAGCDFAVFEAPHTRTERFIAEAKHEVAKEIFAELEQTVMHPNWASQTYKEWYFAELKKKYIGEKGE
jgi:hypothetical protein